MQISMGFLIFVCIQLMLLIINMYMIIFLRMRYHICYSLTDALLSVMQIFNLILLLQFVFNYQGNFAVLIALQCFFAILQISRLGQLFRRMQVHRGKLLLPNSIHESIDTLPGGICFSTPEGRPVLVNRRMNELIYRLTGHTVMNARITWEELQQLEFANGCEKLEEPGIAQGRPDEAGAHMLFLFPDGCIWRFRKVILTEQHPHYIQLEAADISDLYRHSKKLYETNKRLAEQYDRQQALLANIVEINHEKEILSMKIRIHDDLGRSILTTRQHLLSQTLSENSSHLAEVWKRTIRNLSDFKQNDEEAEHSPETELQRAAELIGCHIDFQGNRPTQRKTALMFYALVREALTNAVRHANADRLSVVVSPSGRGYDVEISDNGTSPVSSLTEGNGLGNLRRRLEQEGAALEIKCQNGVVLIARLPAECNNAAAREGSRG